MDKLYIAGCKLDEVNFQYYGCYNSSSKALLRCKTPSCFIGEINKHEPAPENLTGWNITFPKS